MRILGSSIDRQLGSSIRNGVVDEMGSSMGRR